MEKYTPISCDLYDLLELAAMRNTLCQLEIGTDPEHLETLEARIVDLFCQKKVEYARLDNGTTIRLDRLFRLNGKPFRQFC